MISYQPLFKTMREKNITSYALISTNTVNQLCSLLNCSVSDVIEYIEDDPS